MQIKKITTTVFFSFFSIFLSSSEENHGKNNSSKHRSYSCPQELFYRTDETNDSENEVLPIKCACSYKDPKQSYSPLRAKLDEEQEVAAKNDNCKDKLSPEGESDSEESACDKDFRDVDSDEEDLFEMDDIKPSNSKK